LHDLKLGLFRYPEPFIRGSRVRQTDRWTDFTIAYVALRYFARPINRNDNQELPSRRIRHEIWLDCTNQYTLKSLWSLASQRRYTGWPYRQWKANDHKYAPDRTLPPLYVRRKSSPLEFFAAFSGTIWNFNAKFCTPIFRHYVRIHWY